MENIICEIRDVYRAIIELEQNFEQEYGLSFNEAMLLCNLTKTQQMNSGEIADALALSNSNTSKIIKGIEKKGLVKRFFGNEDKRQMYFCLTQKGKNKIEKLHASNIEIPAILQNLLIN